MAKVTLIEMGISCKTCEMSWAANKTEIVVKNKNKTDSGIEFPGKNWAAYLHLEPYDACVPE